MKNSKVLMCLFLTSKIVVINSCKSTNQSQLKDIAAYSGNNLSLYYLEQSSQTVVKAECPPIKGAKSEISGFDLREFCVDNIEKIPFSDFRERLIRAFLLSQNKNSLNNIDTKLLNYTLSRLTSGPYNKDGKQENKGANTIDIKNGKVLDPYTSFNDPAYLRTYLDFVASVTDVFSPQTSSSVATEPKKLKEPAKELQEIPASAKINHTLSRDSYRLPSKFFIEGKIDIENGEAFNGAMVTLENERNEPCSLDVYRVQILSRAGAWKTLFRSPEGQNRFFTTDLSLEKFAAIKIGLVNRNETEQVCELTASGIKYQWKEKEGAWSNAPVSIENRDFVMRDYMGSRKHRLNHYIWHAARNIWNLPSTSDQDRKTLANLGFRPPRPLIYRGVNLDRSKSSETGCGEDFLYMHRVMVTSLRKKLGEYMYRPWTDLPRPNSREFQIFSEPIMQKQDDGYKQLVDWQRKYTNPDYLRQVSLSQMGIDIEFDIHNLMHVRFARPLQEARPVQQDPLRMSGSESWVWDDPTYNHLSDSYSAHVNPIFWKIHGWVDERIEDWLRVHGFNRAADDCKQDKKCYSWKGRWLGVKEWIAHNHSSSSIIHAGHEDGDSLIPDPNAIPPELARKLSEFSFMSQKLN